MFSAVCRRPDSGDITVSELSAAGGAVGNNLADDNDHHSDYKHKNKYKHKHGG
jgi:hypothetical protein